MRTTNIVERTFVEERRRTKVTGHLWDEKSLVKLIFAVLIRVDDRWSRRQFSQLEERMLQKLRVEWGIEREEQPIQKLERNQTRRAAGAVSA